MKIHTSYTIELKKQLVVRNNRKFEITGSRKVNSALMKATAAICLEALKFCVNVFQKEWHTLKQCDGLVQRRRTGDLLIHSTDDNTASYPEFNEKFPYLPSYTRRAVIADALGIVSSYISNHRNWEALPDSERGEEPKLGLPDTYELTFYKQDRQLADIDKGIIGLKLYDGHVWDWYYFQIKPSDAAYINRLSKTRKMLSPVVEKIHGSYCIRFCFEEIRTLVQDKNPLTYTILAIDLGINAPASWCVMTKDGTDHAKGVIHLACEEDRLNHMINRKRMYQQAGKKSRSIYRQVQAVNRQLSISTAREIMKVATLYDVDCIVFEHLDCKGSKTKGRYRERIHMWRANDVQSRVELQAHRSGMRISRICAWNTSRLAYDGSGKTDRHSVYHFEHGCKVYNYSLCTFETGKIYNCDLSAAQNIGARYFLREYARLDNCTELPKTPQRTLSTLWQFTYNGSKRAA